MIQRTLSCAVVCSSILFADTLVLKSGRTVDGTYLGGDSRSVRMASGDRVESFPVGDINRIQFGSDTASAPSTPRATSPRREVLTPEASSSSSSSSATLARRPASPSAESRRNERGMEVPAGTALVIRMIDDVDSQRDSVGQKYRASLDESVMVDGNTVVPKGADVAVKLVDDKQAGKLSGRTVLTLDLESITVDGRAIEVQTQEITQESSSRTSQTGKVVGGTAALGAIIGAIAGGGKGAAIGAVSGAAVGGAAQVITKGPTVKIPSETRLTFTMQQPIRL